MKKIAKLSLVAAIAVAGMTNVNAASLEEAIKGVDVSGQFRFRANELSNGGDDTDVEVEVGVKVPVTENVKAVFKIDTTRNTSDSGQATDASGTQDYLDIEDYYFSYNQGALTVNAGQQNIPGRMTDGDQGDGIVALYNLGSATVGAASFMNNSVPGATGSSVNSVIAMGTVGPVSLLAQYADVADVAKSYNLKADASIAMLKVGVEYTETELEESVNTALNTANATTYTKDDRTTAKAYVSAKAGIVSGKLSYAKTGDSGSGSLDNQTGTETETPSELLLWNLGTASNADMDLYVIDASVAVTPKISLRAAYAAGDIANTSTSGVEEILGQITYKVAKNLTTYVRYADFDKSASSDDNEQRARIEVKYTF